MSTATYLSRSGSRLGKRGAFVALVAAAASVALSGCSSGSSSAKPQVVSIFFTDVNGNTQSTQPSSVVVEAGMYLDATLTNDTSNLGADWTVSCGSQLAPGTPLPPGQTVDDSCGTFTPVHTMSGPVPTFATSGSGYVTLYTPPAAPPKGGTVTIYASATADHSRYASLTLTVVGLPISIGFAPQPPSTLAVNASTPLKAIVNNDYVAGGVKWAVSCKSSDCGSLSTTQTASGVATTYTAPAAPPTGGTVTVTATSATDATKSVSATITIAPLAVTVAPATLSVVAGDTGLLSATVTNDANSAGVDWTVTCGTTDACGSVTAHTASGAPATFTAPSAVPAGGTVTVTATSTSDHTSSASATATITSAPTPTISGVVKAGSAPVAGASVRLFEVGRSGYGSASRMLSATDAVTSEADGSFKASAVKACTSGASLIYVTATQGEAQGKPGQTMVTALGRCASFASAAGVTVNEAATVASAYALASFAADAAHIGSPAEASASLERAFTVSHDLVDIATGSARVLSRAGNIAVPQADLNALANALHACSMEGESSQDVTVCAATFAGVQDTFQSALMVARSKRESAGYPAMSHGLYELADHDGPFQPNLTREPQDWTAQVNGFVQQAIALGAAQ